MRQTAQPVVSSPQDSTSTPAERRLVGLALPVEAWQQLEDAASRQRHQAGLCGEQTARTWLDFWRREQAAGIEPQTTPEDMVRRLALFIHGNDPTSTHRRRGLALARRLVLGCGVES